MTKQKFYKVPFLDGENKNAEKVQIVVTERNSENTVHREDQLKCVAALAHGTQFKWGITAPGHLQSWMVIHMATEGWETMNGRKLQAKVRERER